MTNIKRFTSPTIITAVVVYLLFAAVPGYTRLKQNLKDSHQHALKLYRAGHVTEAADLLSLAIGSGPWKMSNHDIVIFNDLGFFLEQSGRYEEAAAVLKQVVSNFPDRSPAHLNLADTYLGLGKRNKARKHYCYYADLMKKEGKEKRIPKRVLRNCANNQDSEKSNLIDSSSILSSLHWLKDTLQLDKHGYDKYCIASYKISKNGQYSIISVSNDCPQNGPFFRYLLYNPLKREIYYPKVDMITKSGLGYPYITAVFFDDKCAVAYGYRIVEAAVIQLPEGKVIEKKELSSIEIKDIEEELDLMLGE
ncbi:MAG: tetratricopeptide repeat protein [Chitinispirillaceae bacterium]